MRYIWVQEQVRDEDLGIKKEKNEGNLCFSTTTKLQIARLVLYGPWITHSTTICSNESLLVFPRFAHESHIEVAITERRKSIEFHTEA